MIVLGIFPVRDILLVWTVVRQGSTVLVVGAVGAVCVFLLPALIISLLSPSLGDGLI